MATDDDDALDADVPEQAVRGLTAATQRALASGRPVVLVRGRQLVRVCGDEVVVLRQLPPRFRVTRKGKVRNP